ncbi:hypothetical protein ACF09I_12860 [Streptomyces sp. NPDC014940]|uniref:hypothetical protein n=1 Tax=Streptomyces sp. NPDC014940 TaxID=3364932 RepID=UPI0036FDCF90
MPSGAPYFAGVALHGGPGGPADGIGVFATAMSGGVRLARDQAGAGGEPDVPAPDGMAVVRAPEVASALEEADVRVPAETLRPGARSCGACTGTGAAGMRITVSPVSR